MQFTHPIYDMEFANQRILEAQDEIARLRLGASLRQAGTFRQALSVIDSAVVRVSQASNRRQSALRERRANITSTQRDLSHS